MENCNFCNKELQEEEGVLQNKTCIFLSSGKYAPKGVLVGSGIIIPFAHKASPFELSDEELVDMFALLRQVKKYIDEKFNPEGYTIGWNVGKGSDQVEPHVHLHVMPRYDDEPLAGKGIRYFYKQENNRRKSYSDQF